MGTKKLFTTIIVSLLIVIFAGSSVFAVTFKDQADIDNMAWAKEAIMEMAEKGIISGMPDGTFKPNEDIKKLDCLVLIAKALGANDPTKKAEVDTAEEQYKSYLNSYLIYGKREISYLLKKGVIKPDELADYVGANSAYATMLRYEAAIVLVKAMGQEETVKSNNFLVLPFADQNSIPERARAYVDYLYKEDIMKGTSATQFSPFLPVTRAQMAVLLHKASAKMQEVEDVVDVINGTITQVQTDLNLVKVKNKVGGSETTYSLSSAKVTVDGKTRTIDNLYPGMTVAITMENHRVVEIEAESPDIIETEKGIVSAIQSSGVAKRIKVRIEANGKTETKEYLIGSNVPITKDGKEVSNSSIKLNDYAVVELSDDGEVYKLTLEAKEKEVKGTVIDVSTELPASITIEDDDEEYTYLLRSTLNVRRNKRSATLWDVRIGDEATLVLYYDEVEEIHASGKTTTLEGTVEEILISRKPYITIRNEDGEFEKFDVAQDILVEIAEEQQTLYDLRVGYRVVLRLESDVVAEIIAEKAKQAEQITGTVEQVNESIGVVTIVPAGNDNLAPRQLYFPRTSTVKIINAFTGKSMGVRDLIKGTEITAFGYNEMGIFVTTQIIVISE